jgi:hypothetical protein
MARPAAVVDHAESVVTRRRHAENPHNNCMINIAGRDFMIVSGF